MEVGRGGVTRRAGLETRYNTPALIMDDIEDFESALRRSSRRRRIIVTLVAGALGAAPVALLVRECRSQAAMREREQRAQDEQRAAEEAERNRPLSDAEAAELRRLSATIHDTLLARRDRWVHDVDRAALAALEITGAPCTIDPAARYEYRLFKPGEPLRPPDITEALGEADAIAKQVAAGRLVRPDLVRLARLADPGPLMFIVATVATQPHVHGGSVVMSYDAGQLRGTAYAFQDGVVCAGEIDVSNPPTLSIHYQYYENMPLDRETKARQAAEAELESDLSHRVIEALANNLHATAH